jgi:hypothetical protein
MSTSMKMQDFTRNKHNSRLPTNIDIATNFLWKWIKPKVYGFSPIGGLGGIRAAVSSINMELQ